MRYGLFFFAAAGNRAPGQVYDLLLSSARYADEVGFDSVWTPERHFHEFGGHFPNPAVTGAALAAVTERIEIRAGSVVLPLHNPVRVAEEWSVVDNLSNGRAGVSFASGWNRNDFLLAAEPYEQRQEVLWRDIAIVRALWRGEEVVCTGVTGDKYTPVLYPRPVRPELPVWVTTGGSVDSAESAGLIGANLLTHMLGQSFDGIGQLVTAYRQARADAGHRGPGEVTLMLHTFLDEDVDAATELAREPLKTYLRSAIGLSASSIARMGLDIATDELGEDDWDVLLDHAARRYLETSSLIGSPDRCRGMVDRLAEAGVDEIGCLIDFGLADDAVARSLRLLDRLRADTR